MLVNLANSQVLATTTGSLDVKVNSFPSGSIYKTTALTSASQVSVTLGSIRWISGRIDSSMPTSTVFVHLLNTVNGVAKLTSTTTADIAGALKYQHTSGVDDYFTFDFSEIPAQFSLGLQVALSPYEFVMDTTGSYLGGLTVGYR